MNSIINNYIELVGSIILLLIILFLILKIMRIISIRKAKLRAEKAMKEARRQKLLKNHKVYLWDNVY